MIKSANIIVTKPTRTVNTTIQLTGSKSECNRALIIEALSKGSVKVDNISDAADAVTLSAELKNVHSSSIIDHGLNTPAALSETPTEVNIGPAGTAMRFLTAYLTLQNGEVILTGSERMKQRPIGVLVDALRELGAEIGYEENEGYPPLRISGPIEQKVGRIAIKGNISSQYITALLLIAPSLPQGLELEIIGELTSKPYVEMTLAMLEQCGINHTWTDSIISIAPQQFKETSIWVEPDWSAASYWYSIAALSDEAELFLPGLTAYSKQGDSAITEIMANFGITSQFKDGGVYLSKSAKPFVNKMFDLKECPDLAQTVVVVCAALGHNASFTGLETLKIKETDRIAALQNELAKIGVKLIEDNEVYTLDCSGKFIPEHVVFETYEDHRMAMAFAPLAILLPKIEFEDYKVVEKSYPDFWNDLKKAGFVTEVKG